MADGSVPDARTPERTCGCHGHLTKMTQQDEGGHFSSSCYRSSWKLTILMKEWRLTLPVVTSLYRATEAAGLKTPPKGAIGEAWERVGAQPVGSPYRGTRVLIEKYHREIL